MKHTLTMLTALSAAWLLWSGHTDALLLTFGALSVALVTWLDARMDRVAEDHEGIPPHDVRVLLGLRALLYIPWLTWAIIKSNLAIAKVILSPSLPIDPRIIRVEASQSTPIGKVIFANSITLTPGTVTLDVRGGCLMVHALTEDSAQGTLDGDMDRRVTALEGRA